MWPSVRPGITVRPPRSITRAWSPASFFIAAEVPVASTRPPADRDRLANGKILVHGDDLAVEQHGVGGLRGSGGGKGKGDEEGSEGKAQHFVSSCFFFCCPFATGSRNGQIVARAALAGERGEGIWPSRPRTDVEARMAQTGQPLNRVGKATKSAVAQRAKAEACPPSASEAENGGHGAVAPLPTLRMASMDAASAHSYDEISIRLPSGSRQ